MRESRRVLHERYFFLATETLGSPAAYSGPHKNHTISYCFCSSVKTATIAWASDRAWSVTVCRGTPADAAKACYGRVQEAHRENCVMV